MQIFYTDYDTDDFIEANNPKDVDLEKAINSFYDLTDSKDNFWGIITPNNLKLQFLFISTDKWLADIPDAERRGSYQKHLTYNECIVLIKYVYNDTDWKIPGDFVFNPW